MHTACQVNSLDAYLGVPPLSYRLADVIQAAIDTRFSSVHTIMPGIVQEYSRKLQVANVQPAVGVTFKNEYGDVTKEFLPIIPHVPVCFPSGGGALGRTGYYLSFPINKGDPCLLLFASCSTDRWIKEGGKIHPEDDRKFDLGDAFMIPGVRPVSNPLQGPRGEGPPPDVISMGFDGACSVDVDVDAAYVGGVYDAKPANHEIVIQSALDQFIAALLNSIAALDPAIEPANAQAALALSTLYSQLGALSTSLTKKWPAGTTKSRAA